MVGRASGIERPIVCKRSALGGCAVQLIPQASNVQYSIGFGLSRKLCGLLVAEGKGDRISFYSSYRLLKVSNTPPDPIRQTTKHKPQFAVTRLQFCAAEISNFSKALSSVRTFLFSQKHEYI